MKAGQSTDDAAAWRCSFGAYVPPDFDLFDFDLGALGVVRDLCSWRDYQGECGDGFRVRAGPGCGLLAGAKRTGRYLSPCCRLRLPRRM